VIYWSWECDILCGDEDGKRTEKLHTKLFFYMLTVTNMASLRNTEVTSDKFNMSRNLC
jgi:hypothetical protein